MQSSTTVVSEDFESGASGWSDNKTTSGGAGLDGSYLGNFCDTGGAQTIYKTFTLSGDQDSVTINFDFWEFDTWNGEDFKIWVDEVLISTDVYYTQEYYGSLDLSTYGTATSGTSSDLGHASFYDQIHSYSFTIDSSATSIKLGFGASLDEALSNNTESWGIDNVEIIENEFAATVSVAEDAANGAVVGTASGTDADAGETLTYSFTDNAGGRFAIDSSTGQITVADGTLLDYETATSHDVTVRVTDAAGATYDETFTIAVSDEAEGTSPTHEGTTGNDSYVGGGSGNDVINGYAGDDTIYGQSGNDQIYGGSGNDTLYGEGGVDSLYGGSGDDTLDGGASGRDTHDGGEGSDTYYAYGDGYRDTYTDSGSSGTDTIILKSGTGTVFELQSDFSAASAGVEAIDGTNVSGEVLRGDGSSGALDWDFTDITLTGADKIAGRHYDDRITGSAGDDYIVGGDGGDTLQGEGGSDLFLILQGQGDDTVYGAAGWTDTIELQDGAGGSNIGDYGSDWTVNLTIGSIESSSTTGANGWLDLTDDAAGTINMQDGTQVDFAGIEHIQW